MEWNKARVEPNSYLFEKTRIKYSNVDIDLRFVTRR